MGGGQRFDLALVGAGHDQEVVGEVAHLGEVEDPQVLHRLPLPREGMGWQGQGTQDVPRAEDASSGRGRPTCHTLALSSVPALAAGLPACGKYQAPRAEVASTTCGLGRRVPEWLVPGGGTAPGGGTMSDVTAILLAWLGKTDLDACRDAPVVGVGPIARALESRRFRRVVLLNNYPKKEGDEYRDWLAARTSIVPTLRHCSFKNPTDYVAIYRHASAAAAEIAAAEIAAEGRPLVFHLSPGTSAMTAVWILLAKTRYRECSELIQSSRESGVETVDVPFDVYAEFAPDLLRRSDDELLRLTQGLAPEAPEFEAIVHRCDAMKFAVAIARRLAPRELPVLVQGESGTGKELFARAVHKASRRAEKPFVAVNCGAIPTELVDSELFGHKKGAFTGAVSDRQGVFEEAHGGTLFLDEVGELTRSAQVRLLRVLQEGKIRRVGDSRERAVDVNLLVDHLLDEIHRQAAESQPGKEGCPGRAAATSSRFQKKWETKLVWSPASPPARAHRTPSSSTSPPDRRSGDWPHWRLLVAIGRRHDPPTDQLHISGGHKSAPSPQLRRRQICRRQICRLRSRHGRLRNLYNHPADPLGSSSGGDRGGTRLRALV